MSHVRPAGPLAAGIAFCSRFADSSLSSRATAFLITRTCMPLSSTTTWTWRSCTTKLTESVSRPGLGSIHRLRDDAVLGGVAAQARRR